MRRRAKAGQAASKPRIAARLEPKHSRSQVKSLLLAAALFVSFNLYHASYNEEGNLRSRSTSSEPCFEPQFPIFGSAAYERRCPWVSHRKQSVSDWTVLATTVPQGHEGLAAWVSAVAHGFLLSEQLNARFIMDYGVVGVNLQQVMEPQASVLDWAAPKNFSCTIETKCKLSLGLVEEGASKVQVGETSLARTPVYRHASKVLLQESDFLELYESLPGFNLADGMACSMQKLFRLSDRATQYQPDIHSTILPALRSNSTLALTLYIRTGHTEELSPADTSFIIPTALRGAMQVTNCAMELEQAYEGTKTVWMVVTDSQVTKNWVIEKFQTEARTVLVTTSHGKHTRPQDSPTTRDFAEAFLDWYLIGESNAVISNNRWYSFGFTAALRTSRPLYEATNSQPRCNLVEWIQ